MAITHEKFEREALRLGATYKFYWVQPNKILGIQRRKVSVAVFTIEHSPVVSEVLYNGEVVSVVNRTTGIDSRKLLSGAELQAIIDKLQTVKNLMEFCGEK